MTLALACFLGALFGFVLHRVGAANPEYLIGMLRLRDLHLMKAILLGIGLANVLLFGGLASGAIDASHIEIKAASIGVLLGGALLGVGWGAVGYCPGTGVAAIADGRRDAAFFLFGGLAGALAFMLSYSFLEGSIAVAPLAGGKTSLVVTGSDSHASWIQGEAAWMAGVAIGAVFILIAWWLPPHPRLDDASDTDTHGSAESARA